MDHDAYYFHSQYQDEDEHVEDEYLQDVPNVKELESDPLLISLVRDHPYLYNKELTDFKDSLKKQNAWSEIASIMGMTADECQSRWTRLRERYSREKKQQQEETTTGSGVSKRKPFELFDNMQFLEGFVKRRRTMTNLHNKKIPTKMAKFSNLCKNFGSLNEKENNSSSVNLTAMTHNRSAPSIARSFNVQKDPELYIEEDNNSSFLNVAATKPNTTIPPMTKSSNVHRDSDLYNEDDNLSYVNVPEVTRNKIKPAMMGSSNIQNKSSLTSSLHSNVSDIPSISASSSSDHIWDKHVIGQRRQSKKKSEPDILESAIGKVSSLLENRCVSSSQSSLKPEVEENWAFCQLIYSLLINMSENTKIEKKKAILRLLYDI